MRRSAVGACVCLAALVAVSLARPSNGQAVAAQGRGATGTLRGRVEILHPARDPLPRPGMSSLGADMVYVPAEHRQAVVYLETPPPSPVGTLAPMRVSIRQQREMFVPHVLAVVVGSTVDFPNADPFFHNVFSFSKPHPFDLGRYPKGHSRSVRFDSPGVVQVFCDIHSQMSAFILVFAHRFFAVTDDQGRYQIEGVPPGRYVVVAWYEGRVRCVPCGGRAGRRRAGGSGFQSDGPMTIFSTLTNRIFVASAVLTLLCISTAIYVVNRRVTEAAEDELRHELVRSAALVDEQRQSVSELFTIFARTVADLPKLKAAVATDDPPTVGPIAADYARTVHASLLLVTDRSGRVLAERVDSSPSATASGLRSVEGALGGRETATFWVSSPGGILQVVSVPIAAGAAPPEIIGSLSLGFQLDDALAARFKAQTGSEIAFATGSRVVASSLPPSLRGPLAGLATKSGITRVWCGPVEYVALVTPLVSPRPLSMSAAAAVTGPRDGAPAPLVAIILRSRTERLRLLEPIRAALLGTGALAMLLAIGLSYGIARTITRPIGVITATMKEMSATGDLEKKITWPSSRWTDEDARLLATTFNSMTAAIARFQREASLRERLSALGRLSTVIAHEVRNPLMIIKGALRPLSAGSPSPAEVREAASDIDGEVSRLNRLVNDVLDFARQLRFDLGPTDVNALCAQCAAAVEGGDAPGPPVRVISDPSVPVLVTDGERLRSVLVNLLANARHAVVARNGAPPPDDAGPQVEIETRRLDGGVAIDVRDRGVGIEPENLPRVFDPYFTTSRGGTGLGLAISRNIVDGLGGTIRITSRVGSGTDVRIELWNASGARPADKSGGTKP